MKKRVAEIVGTLGRSQGRSRKGGRESASSTPLPGPPTPDQDPNTPSFHSTPSGAPLPLPPSDQAGAAMDLGGDDLQLNCIIEGESEAFVIDVGGSLWHNPKFKVSHLKEKIQEKRKDDSLAGVGAHILVLWKPKDTNPIDVNLDDLESVRGDEQLAEKLPPARPVGYFFPNQPPLDRLHIVVRNPDAVSHTRSSVSPQHLTKRPRLGEPPHTPPANIQVKMVEAKTSPPRLTLKETEANLAAALAGFENYMEYLATGKLDGYLDSNRREDKVTDLEVHLPLDPILLLHDLGKHLDQERVSKLFIHDTVHLFGVSGSGKTRLSLEGLCQNWGLYISCRSKRGPASGSDDFETATEMLQSMSTWHQGTSATDIFKNADAADRVFAMLLCARVFIFKQLLQRVPIGTDATLARRRWILAQVLPPRLTLEGDDLFVKVVRDLRYADTKIMLKFIRSTLRALMQERKDWFPVGSATPLFVVIDEAQVAADYLTNFFRSTTGTDLRPILREMYRFFQASGIFAGIILSGTGLSMKMVKDAVGSVSAKEVDKSVQPRVFTDIGRFTRDNSSQVVYIRRYLTLSDDDISDRRLLERMVYWFSGRHRLTASLIELLLYSENVPRHRVLTSFAEQLTGFKITDALELEDDEPPISPGLSLKIERYRPICELDRLFKEQDGAEFIQCLVDVLMRWTLGSQTTSVPVERDMHYTIALGIGFLDKMASTRKFDPDVNYPVYISEPLVVLSLRSLFEEQSWTTRRTWMIGSFRNARNNSSLGFVYEEVALCVLMEIFGGKFNPLADAFHCSGSLGSRRVTLVSLKRGPGGVMQSYPVSWNTGGSDCFGLKARFPADVLTFLNDPDGRAFLFPDTHMGPDLLCFLQDEETKELILAALQGKISPTLNAQTWRSAVISLMPEFFYTVVGGGKRSQYAPVSYPNLIKDLMGTLDMVLGPEVCAPIADTYRSNLRSRTKARQQSASYSTRQTPRFLRIIATPDDEQQKRLEGEWKGDMAVLQWDVVKEYLGSTADLVKAAVGV